MQKFFALGLSSRNAVKCVCRKIGALLRFSVHRCVQVSLLLKVETIALVPNFLKQT